MPLNKQTLNNSRQRSRPKKRKECFDLKFSSDTFWKAEESGLFTTELLADHSLDSVQDIDSDLHQVADDASIRDGKKSLEIGKRRNSNITLNCTAADHDEILVENSHFVSG